MPVDEALYEYATDVERRALDAIKEYGHAKAAERALGLGNDTISKAVRRVKARAAKSGYAPGHFEWGTAPGYHMGKVTVQRGADGEVERVWERQHPDQARLAEAMEEAVAAMAASIPRASPVVAPAITSDDLTTLYTLTDAHIGAFGWHREGGADWDLRIAEDVIVGCFQEAIRSAPASSLGILNQLGDLLHYDGLSAVTPTSGHILDADGRFTKMVEVAVRVLRRIVAMMLEKHQSVHLILAEGNHDIASSVWLRTMFKALYENEPRITVDDSALPYYAFEFGYVGLFFHHSHLRKFNEIGRLIPAQFPEIWGRTKKRYCHTGNLHHERSKDEAGLVIIQHPTLAARDAYAARGMWHSLRAMTATTYHRDFGRIGEVMVCPEMIQ